MNEPKVLITGASGLIGRALVSRFTTAGWSVIAPTRKECDLSIGGALSNFITRGPKCDLLINNAANQSVLDPENYTQDELTQLFQTNLFAPLEAMVAAHKLGFGSAINISSIEASSPRGGHEIYGASKAALEALTRSMAVALAPMRINAIRLGLVGDASLADRWPEGVAAWRAATPVARYASPAEVAEFALAISGDAFNYTTGSIFDFDGGKSASPGW